MKRIAMFSLFILMGVSTWAQETDLPERDISIVVLDKKGRPLDKIIVRSLSNSSAGMTDRKGLFVFTGMTDDDRISVYLPKYGETVIPVAGMDSIVVTLRSARRYSFVDNEGKSVFIDRPNNTEASTVIDVQVLLQQNAYRSLLDLLQGRVPGLNITQSTRTGGATSTNIRGQRSLMLSNEPLVVLDGMPMDITLGDIDAMINVYDVKTVEVQKSASEWGVRGANGVILIKTR